MRNELNANIYDVRGFEALSDNFAAQHGAGFDFVIALDTMPSMKYVKKNTTQALLYNSLTTSVRLANFIFAPGLAVIGTIMAIALHMPSEKIYDDPKDRFKRISDNLILTLKDNRNGDNAKLVEEVIQIQKIMDSYHNRRGFIETLYETVTPNGRDSKSLRELNQHLEEFSNNKLYLAAAKFTQLG